MFATTQEINQYARLTFKQHGLADFSLVFVDKFDHPKAIGQAAPWNKQIELSEKALSSFALFRLVLLHEIAHCIQFKRMGNTFQVNGRNNFHGKIFKQVCREMGISFSTKI